MEFPKDLMHTDNDERIRVEGTTGTVGITDYAQDQLSDVVYVELVVSEDEVVAQGDTCATIESVKAAADVYMPVSGKIIATNEELADTPELVNSEPHGAAWLVKLEMSDSSELEGLMDAAAYEKFTAEKN